jgi:energy-coupling factor transporter ATP-binding protein EcfA2
MSDTSAMYLETVNLKNFKAFVGAELNFGKITLLLGANSAGKSSLLYSILAALQSDQFPLALSINGPFVDLGDFTSVVHGHRKNLTIAIGLEFRGHELGDCNLSGSFKRLPKTDMPDVSSAVISDPYVRLNLSRMNRYQARWNYVREGDPIRTGLLKTGGARQIFRSLDQFIKTAAKSSGKGSNVSSFLESIKSPLASGHFSFNRLDQFFDLQGLLQPKYLVLSTHVVNLLKALSDYRSNFNYIGSVRLEPQRSYYYASTEDLKVGRYGQNYVEQIAKWQDERSDNFGRLIQALRSLELVSSIKASRLKNGNFEIQVRARKSSLSVSLTDVGLGIAELLPVLVADLQLSKGGTLAVSQPESHLHPSAQASLASYFAKATRLNRRRYIIETHSEYLINRLRLLVAQGKLASEDLSIIYLSNDGRDSSPHSVSFLPNGKIEGAPKDFFQTYMMDVMNLAISAKP